MAAPVFVDCPKNAWTKVATAVVSGTVHRMDLTPGIYLQTYALTGEAAPTLRTEGVPAFCECGKDPISASAEIDVYIWADRSDGRVRVDAS